MSTANQQNTSEITDRLVPTPKSMQLIDFAQQLRLRRHGTPFPQTVCVSEIVEAARNYERFVSLGYRLFQQNTALFPKELQVEIPVFKDPAPELLYKGTERKKAIKALIEHLRDSDYDVVGLSECFDKKAIKTIRSKLKSRYPYIATGPKRKTGVQPLWRFQFFDSGLLLLSRYPIQSKHTSIYPHCLGEDCFAAKGVLHARIQPPDHRPALDVFLSHLQSINPEFDPTQVDHPNVNPFDSDFWSRFTGNEGRGNSGWEKIQWQLRHLSSFVKAYSHPDRPSVLMGDLNVDGMTTEQYDFMMSALDGMNDVWQSWSPPFAPGITFDSQQSFASGTSPKPFSDSARHKSGQRLDYFIENNHQSLQHESSFKSVGLVMIESSPDRQVSDHYGVAATLATLNYWKIDRTRPIQRVSVQLKSFHCLNRNEVGSDGDEMSFGFSAAPQQGSAQHWRTPGRTVFHEIAVGDSREIADVVATDHGVGTRPWILTFSDPGSYLGIQCRATEVDEGFELPGVDFDPDDALGDATLLLKRDTLLRIQQTSGITDFVLPLIVGDDAEYAVTVTVMVR